MREEGGGRNGWRLDNQDKRQTNSLVSEVTLNSLLKMDPTSSLGRQSDPQGKVNETQGSVTTKELVIEIAGSVVGPLEALVEKAALSASPCLMTLSTVIVAVVVVGGSRRFRDRKSYVRPPWSDLRCGGIAVLSAGRVCDSMPVSLV